MSASFSDKTTTITTCWHDYHLCGEIMSHQLLLARHKQQTRRASGPDRWMCGCWFLIGINTHTWHTHATTHTRLRSVPFPSFLSLSVTTDESPRSFIKPSASRPLYITGDHTFLLQFVKRRDAEVMRLCWDNQFWEPRVFSFTLLLVC